MMKRLNRLKLMASLTCTAVSYRWRSRRRRRVGFSVEEDASALVLIVVVGRGRRATADAELRDVEASLPSLSVRSKHAWHSIVERGTPPDQIIGEQFVNYARSRRILTPPQHLRGILARHA
jgi:hypothetical protein